MPGAAEKTKKGNATKTPSESNKPVAGGGPVAIEILYPVDPLPIAHIHFVKFSQLGSEILMDVGTIDDQSAIARLSGTASEEDKLKPIKAYVTTRFGMSPNTFGLLRGNIDELWQKMKASGALKQIGIEDSDVG